MVRWSPRSLFLPLSFFFGLCYVLITPPFQSPDEPNHFFRAWQLSEGGMLPKPTADHRLGAELPRSLTIFRDSFLYLKNNPSARLHPDLPAWALRQPLRPEERAFTDFANTAIYAPAGYLPQAVAIALLRPFGCSPLLILFAARLANLLVWLLLARAALRRLPVQQEGWAALALLPSVVWLSASANADILVNGLCWWLIATLFSHPRAREGWKIALGSGAIGMAKLIAVVSAGAVFFTGRPIHRSRYWALAGVLSALFWAWLAQQAFIPYDAYHPDFRDSQTLNSGVNPSGQLAFIAAHPGQFIHLITRSFCEALPSMAAHLTGKFGWEKNYLPTPILVLLWGMLAALLCTKTSGLRARNRAGLLGLTALYVLLFAITMYALWYAVGSARFDNWQARYFTPVIPLLWMALANGFLKKRAQILYPAAGGILVAAHIACVGSIAARYWF